ncbi:hypothetical protein LI82_10300 [Methanococcoides methylutens]|uniref:Uncharacterized protein n=1 Tax=Methanococcoides methylutens TaxID=2226 RepID=A0A099SZ11_METMT|nr:hypothetical protein [Methanococcoides methylutens]KGK98115.1 hypothetical protein LI82_10300 [Methanococcoides methylutens]
MVIALFRDRQAVTAVVSVLLILVVLTTFVTAIRAYYIPALAAEHEIDHMQEVHKSFTEFAAKACSDTSSGVVHMPLGDGGLPFYSSLSSSGMMTLDPGGSSINISLENISEVSKDVDGVTTIHNITNVSSLRMWTDNLEPGEYTVFINNNTENRTSIFVDPDGGLRTETFANNSTLLPINLRYGGSSNSLILGNTFGMDLLNMNQSEFPVILNNTYNNHTGPSPFSLTFNGSFQVTYTPVNETLNISTGYFKYRASNNYWIDQELIFENGAVILKQGRNSEIRSYPFISFENNGSLLHMSVFNITGKKSSISGNGNSIVNLRVVGAVDYFYSNVSNTSMEISSEQADAWNKFFISMANDTRIEDDTVYSSFHNRTVWITTRQVEVILP